MSIDSITGSSSNPISSLNAQPNKSESAKPSGQSTQTTKSVDYSSASIADLEALAAQGDAKAQAELAKRAAEEQQNQSSGSSANGSSLNVVA